MISKAASSFWRRYGGLPEEIQRLTERNYRIWLENQRHPSLRFKPFRAG